MKSILCDIDHTVSNAFWRDNMIGQASWDEYHSASVNDKPIECMAGLMRRLHGAYNIIGFTARPEKFRVMTMKWLIKYQIPMDELLMRENEKYEPAPRIKEALIKKRFGDNLKEEVAFVLEDREDVCTMFKGLGLTVLQVHGCTI